jgi:hypothetical protein
MKSNLSDEVRFNGIWSRLHRAGAAFNSKIRFLMVEGNASAPAAMGLIPTKMASGVATSA